MSTSPNLSILRLRFPHYRINNLLAIFLHGLKVDIKGKVRSLSAVGSLSRGKLLQVTRVVERGVRGDTRIGYNRHSKLGQGSSKPKFGGTHKGGGSDWIMVKGKDGGPIGSNNGGNVGPRNEKGRSGPRDRG